MSQQPTLQGKLSIQAILRLETGLHIGAAKDFAPIGSVDSPFIRDPISRQPMIPGSSIKGKMRTLLARSFADGYWLPEITQDPESVARLFGLPASEQEGTLLARLQFFDLRMTEASFTECSQLELDTYIGEVKFENSISRATAVANPRQIERVPRGAEFAFRLVYNLERFEAERESEVTEDLQTLAQGLKLLQWDYLGGSGSRGYGRISLHDFQVTPFALRTDEDTQKKVEQAAQEAEKVLGDVSRENLYLSPSV